MFLSTDSGASWTSINEGFPVCPKPAVEASCADDNYLFAGTFGDGVWRKLLNPVFASPTPTPTPSATVFLPQHTKPAPYANTDCYVRPHPNSNSDTTGRAGHQPLDPYASSDR